LTVGKKNSRKKKKKKNYLNMSSSSTSGDEVEFVRKVQERIAKSLRLVEQEIAALPKDEVRVPSTVFAIWQKRFPQSIGLSKYTAELLKAASAGAQSANAEQVAMVLLEQLAPLFGGALPVDASMLAAIVKMNASEKLTPQTAYRVFRVLAPHTVTSAFDMKNQWRNVEEIDAQVAAEAAAPQLLSHMPMDVSYEDVFERHLYVNENIKALVTPAPLVPVDAERLPGLMRGTTRPMRYTERTRINNVMAAEALTRLMNNYAFGGERVAAVMPQPPGVGDALFSISVDGVKCVRLDEFARALASKRGTGGAQLRTGIVKAAATFGTVLSVMPAPDSPVLLDVPLTLFMRSGIFSDVMPKVQAQVPLIHTGLFVKLAKGDAGAAADDDSSVEFHVEFYLGSGGTAKFRPDIGYALPWNKQSYHDIYEGDDATKSLLCAAIYGNAINSYAFKEHLCCRGYGCVGICADSIAPIQQVMSGHCTLYPILGMTERRVDMMRQMCSFFTLFAEDAGAQQDAAASSSDVSAATIYRTCDARIVHHLVKALIDLPNDNALALSEYVSTIDRIMASIPWPQGEEPFRSTSIAWHILKAERKRHTEAVDFLHHDF
jgi:hypothetical protein